MKITGDEPVNTIPLLKDMEGNYKNSEWATTGITLRQIVVYGFMRELIEKGTHTNNDLAEQTAKIIAEQADIYFTAYITQLNTKP